MHGIQHSSQSRLAGQMLLHRACMLLPRHSQVTNHNLKSLLVL